jgi:hypothetical protein
MIDSQGETQEKGKIIADEMEQPLFIRVLQFLLLVLPGAPNRFARPPGEYLQYLQSFLSVLDWPLQRLGAGHSAGTRRDGTGRDGTGRKVDCSYFGCLLGLMDEEALFNFEQSRDEVNWK